VEGQLKDQQLLPLFQGLHPDKSQAPLQRVRGSVLWAVLSVQSGDQRYFEESKCYFLCFRRRTLIDPVTRAVQSCLSCYKKLIGGSEAQSLVLNNNNTTSPLPGMFWIPLLCRLRLLTRSTVF
jgi:hypothetical protein